VKTFPSIAQVSFLTILDVLDVQCGLMAVVAIAPIPAQCAGDFNPDPAHRSV
jgi:hypothetical protein